MDITVQTLAVAVVTTECASHSMMAVLATVMLDGKVQTLTALQVSPYCTLNTRATPFYHNCSSILLLYDTIKNCIKP